MKSLWLFLVAGMVVLSPGCAWFRPSESAVPPSRAQFPPSDTDWIDKPNGVAKKPPENVDKPKN